MGRVRPRKFGAVESDRAAQRCAKSRNGLGELPLPVPRDPGDTDDLTGGDLERQPPDGLDPAISLDPEVCDREPHATTGALRRLALQGDAAADHQLHQSGPGRFGRRDRADVAAAP